MEPPTNTRWSREEVDLSRYAVPPGAAPGASRKPTGKKPPTTAKGKPPAGRASKPGKGDVDKATGSTDPSRKPSSDNGDAPETAIPLTPDDILFGAASTGTEKRPKDADVITIDGEISRELPTGSALDRVQMARSSRDPDVDQAGKAGKEPVKKTAGAGKSSPKKAPKATAKSTGKSAGAADNKSSAKAKTAKGGKPARSRSTDGGSEQTESGHAGNGNNSQDGSKKKRIS